MTENQENQENHESPTHPHRPKLKTIAPPAVAPLKARVLAWAVHLFTMSGMAFAVLATLAMIEGELKMMWLWLVIAMLIDAIDGTFARAARVKEVLPWFDGGILDIIIDYLTWTFIPAMFMYMYLPLGPKWLAGVLMLVVLTSSTLCYANEHWKSNDYYFYGFPAAWNIVAVILWVFQGGALWNFTWIVIFIILTVVPVYWTHPFRVKKLMALNLAAITVWITATAVQVVMFPVTPMWARIAFLVSGIYFLGTGVVRTFVGEDRPKR
jgi:phosphatidylcholine synthase